MSSRFQRLGGRCWLAVAVILLLCALVLSAMRGALLVASHYQNELVAWLTNDVDINVELTALSAELSDFRPLLVVEGVEATLPGDTSNQFKADKVLLDFDWWQSIKQQQWVFKDITLAGFQTQLSFDPFIQEPAAMGAAGRQQSLANLFLEQLKNVTLTNSVIELSLPKGMRELYIERLNWRNDNGLHQGDGLAYVLNQQHSGEIRFRIDLDGDADALEQMSGQVYVQIKDLNLQALSPFSQQLKQGLSISSQINVDLWGQFGPTETASIVAKWLPSTIDWQQDQQSHHLMIEQGLVSLNQHAQGWKLDKHPWTTRLDHSVLEDFDLQAWLGKQALHVRLQELELADWFPLLGIYKPDLPSGLLAQFHSGRLDLATLQLDRDTFDLDYHVNLSDLSTSGYAYFPQMENLSLELQGDTQQAQLQVLQQGGEFGIPAQFEQAWQVNTLDASVQIDFKPQGVQATSKATLLSTPELDFAGQWGLQWTKASPWPLFSLMSNVDVKNAGKAYLYYPKVMPAKVFQYLQPALVTGQAQHSQVLWYGVLNRFPYKKHDGIFQAKVPLQQASFAFDPHWPALDELQLELLFQNAGLFMESHSAKLGEVPALHITASIPEFKRHSDLFITGKVAGEASAVVDYLMQSPVNALVTSLDQLEISQQNLSGEVNLHIPLYPDKVSTTGYVDFQDNNLFIKPLGMTLQGLNGRLSFTDEQLSSRDLSAMWRELPLDIKFETASVAQDYQILLDLGGHWPITQMEQAFSAGFGDYLEGELAWQSALQVKLLEDGSFSYQADLGSDLLGASLVLPAPFVKADTEAWPTVFSLSGDSHQGRFSIDAEQYVFARGSYQLAEGLGPQIDSLYLHLGKGRSGSWQRPGVGLELELSHLQLEPWLDLYQNVTMAQSDDEVKPYSNVQFGLPPLRFVRAEIEQVDLYGQALSDFNFAYLPLANTQWQIESEQLVASVAVPEEANIEHPVKVVIEKAQLPALLFETESDETQEQLASFDADRLLFTQAEVRHIREQLPPVSLSCKACKVGRFNLGDVSLELPMQDQQLKDGRLRVNWGHSQLNAELTWSEQDEIDRSGVKGVFSSDSLDQFIIETGIDSPLQETPTQVDFDLMWQGLLFYPDPHTLNGDLKVKAGAGVLTEVSDQGTRLFTLASLDTIRRRLQLNFSDVFEKGMHFDEVQASVTFNDGLVENNDFFMDGVAGKMRGAGSVDLKSGNVDYLVSYSPKVTSSLPVLTAFLVTPVTGVAVFALAKIFEPVVEVITQIDFALTGNINQIELIELERIKQNIDVPEAFRTTEDPSTTAPTQEGQ